MAKKYNVQLLDTVTDIKESITGLEEIETFKVTAKTSALELVNQLERLDINKMNLDNELEQAAALTTAQFTEQNVRLSEGIRTRYWKACKAVAKSDLKDKELAAALTKAQQAFFESLIPRESIPEKGLTLTKAKGAKPVEKVLIEKDKMKWAGWLKTRSAWEACSQLNLHIKKVSLDQLAPNGRVITKKAADKLAYPKTAAAPSNPSTPQTPEEAVKAAIQTLKKRLCNPELDDAAASTLISSVSIMLSDVAVDRAKAADKAAKAAAKV